MAMKDNFLREVKIGDRVESRTVGGAYAPCASRQERRGVLEQMRQHTEEPL